MSSERYTVYVDVSAKIEDWVRDSVIAVANGHALTLLIKAETKRAAATLIQSDEPAQFTLLALFTYFAVRSHLQSIGRIVIDQDYSGELAERFIQQKLLEFIRFDAPEFRGKKISMKNVKNSRADHLARVAYKRKVKIDGEITLTEIRAALQQKS